MKNDEFTQLTLWSEAVLQELEIAPRVDEISEIDQGSGKSSHESGFIQLTLPEEVD